MVCVNSRRKRLPSGRGSAAVALESVQAERYLAPIPARAQDGHQDPCSSLSPSLQGTQKSQKIRKSRLESPARAQSTEFTDPHRPQLTSSVGSFLASQGIGTLGKGGPQRPSTEGCTSPSPPSRVEERARRCGPERVFGVAKLSLILLASGSGLGDQAVGCVHV